MLEYQNEIVKAAQEIANFIKGTAKDKMSCLKNKMPQIRFIIGADGIGKATTFKKALLDNGINTSKDNEYFSTINRSYATAAELYQYFWENNGKICLIHNTKIINPLNKLCLTGTSSLLFQSACGDDDNEKENKEDLWKSLLSYGTGDFCTLNAPIKGLSDKEIAERYYDPSKEQQDKSDTKVQKIPTTFKFTGQVVVISYYCDNDCNGNVYDLKVILGENLWELIKSKEDDYHNNSDLTIECEPECEDLWSEMNNEFECWQKNEDKYGNHLDDVDIPIPKDYIDDVADMIEETIDDTYHQQLNYHIIQQIQQAFKDNGGDFDEDVIHDIIEKGCHDYGLELIDVLDDGDFLDYDWQDHASCPE